MTLAGRAARGGSSTMDAGREPAGSALDAPFSCLMTGCGSAFQAATPLGDNVETDGKPILASSQMADVDGNSEEVRHARRVLEPLQPGPRCNGAGSAVSCKGAAGLAGEEKFKWTVRTRIRRWIRTPRSLLTLMHLWLL